MVEPLNNLHTLLFLSFSVGQLFLWCLFSSIGISIGSVMSVRVVARIRPLLEQELDKDVIVYAESVEEGKTASVVKIPNPKNGSEEFSFAFNGVYDRDASQEQLYTAEGTPSSHPLSTCSSRGTPLTFELQWPPTSSRSSKA